MTKKNPTENDLMSSCKYLDFTFKISKTQRTDE
jgi:hypothetical protein